MKGCTSQWRHVSSHRLVTAGCENVNYWCCCLKRLLRWHRIRVSFFVLDSWWSNKLKPFYSLQKVSICVVKDGSQRELHVYWSVIVYFQLRVKRMFVVVRPHGLTQRQGYGLFLYWNWRIWIFPERESRQNVKYNFWFLGCDSGKTATLKCTACWLFARLRA